MKRDALKHLLILRRYALAMFRSLDQFVLMHDAERARIARWFRESEHGWLFYDGHGRAHRISASEAARLEHQAVRAVERFIEEERRQPRRFFAGAFATFLYATVVLAALPAQVAWAWPAALAPCIAWLGFELMSGVRFRIAQRRWRQAQAGRFAFRGAVPAEAEARHRRYNLFHCLSGACALAAVAHVGWLMIVRHDDPQLDMIDFVLMGLAWLLYLPARRVDATHRRRRSLE